MKRSNKILEENKLELHVQDIFGKREGMRNDRDVIPVFSEGVE